MSLKLDKSYLKGFIDDKSCDEILPSLQKAHHDLVNKTGKGREFTGWMDLPSKIENSFLKELNQLGQEVRKSSQCLVTVGIGGSYLGIRATVEFLRNPKHLSLYYAGHNMSVDYMRALLETLRNKKVIVVVISKSGATIEPALAFRILKQFLNKKYSAKELKKRIICVTDAKKGALRQIAVEEGYRSFIIPDDVGGRFSVLTPAGLVPLALAGVDIKKFVEGARAGQIEYGHENINENLAYQYAAARYLLYKKGKQIEVLSSFYDHFYYVMEWWKQLFGESEGKEGKGLFPASLSLSTDLHSMGQWMQEGVRNVFETFLTVEKSKFSIKIPDDKEDLDKFNFVAGKDLDFVNKQAFAATAAAHFEGGVPNMTISLPQANEFYLGQLYYFFEKAAAVSGYLLGVNPFDQPGVEAYKEKMFELLGGK